MSKFMTSKALYLGFVKMLISSPTFALKLSIIDFEISTAIFIVSFSPSSTSTLPLEFEKWVEIEAFKACSSKVELQFIFYSWTSKELCSSSRENASMSFDSSMEHTT